MMSAKRRQEMVILTVIMLVVGVASTASPLSPPRKFIYGVWGNAYDSSYTPGPPSMAAFVPASDPQFTSSMDILQDTLGFNMAFNEVWNRATAEALIARGFKVVEFDSSYQPGGPSDYAQDWYLVWQTDPASIPPWYQGVWNGFQGRQTTDGAATVWVIGNQPGDARGWMCQTGGSHYKYKSLDVFPVPTTRRAVFKLKATGVAPTDTVAAVYCAKYYWRDGSGELVQDTVAADTIFGSEFTGGYKDFTISWQHQNPPAMWRTIWARYSVYWFGKGTLYFDQVLSTDGQGSGVVAGNFDPNIDGYTTKFTYGTDGSYLLGWYLLAGC